MVQNILGSRSYRESVVVYYYCMTNAETLLFPWLGVHCNDNVIFRSEALNELCNLYNTHLSFHPLTDKMQNFIVFELVFLPSCIDFHSTDFVKPIRYFSS